MRLHSGSALEAMRHRSWVERLERMNWNLLAVALVPASAAVRLRRDFDGDCWHPAAAVAAAVAVAVAASSMRCMQCLPFGELADDVE